MGRTILARYLRAPVGTRRSGRVRAWLVLPRVPYTRIVAEPLVMKNVYDNILQVVGNTPLVKLNAVTAGIEATVYAKVEYLNPGSSVKDRIAMQIIEDLSLIHI